MSDAMRFVRCTWCHGNGIAPGSRSGDGGYDQECPRCDGTGSYAVFGVEAGDNATCRVRVVPSAGARAAMGEMRRHGDTSARPLRIVIERELCCSLCGDRISTSKDTRGRVVYVAPCSCTRQ